MMNNSYLERLFHHIGVWLKLGKFEPLDPLHTDVGTCTTPHTGYRRRNSGVGNAVQRNDTSLMLTLLSVPYCLHTTLPYVQHVGVVAERCRNIIVIAVTHGRLFRG